VTGDRFLFAGEQNNDRIENRVLEPEIAYAAYSLFPPGGQKVAPWTPLEAIEHFLIVRLGTPLIVKDAPPAQTTMENVAIEDAGDDAMARLLTYVPGMDIYIDAQGNCVLYDQRSGEEEDIRNLLPPLQTSGSQVEVRRCSDRAT